MALITISGLEFTYEGGTEPVFSGLDLQFDSRWRLGLVGANGRGKTTLLRLLAGELRPDRGEIAGARAELAFPAAIEDPWEPAEEAVRAAAPGVERWQLLREMRLLELGEELLWRPFGTLSGGEQTRLMLAMCFARQGKFLLLDEPTNHLDAGARERVATYLEKKEGYLLVSHDRALLDRCTDHTLALLPTRAEVCRGGFSVWFRENETRNAREAAEQEGLRREIRRLKQSAEERRQKADAVERAKYGGQSKSGVKNGLRPYLGEKSRKGQQQRKNIQRRQERAAAEKEALLKDVEQAGELKLAPERYGKERLLELEGVSLFYGGAAVCQKVDLKVDRGERVCLSGPNGCGKSSLLNLIQGAPIEHTGRVAVGGGLKISYVSQTTDGLSGSLLEYAAAQGLDPSRLLTVLRKLGVPREAFQRDMGGYSAGQKKKVLLAGSLCCRAHLYIWDEPLNYLDVFARQQLEELVLTAGASMLFVEHDPVFRRRVATRVVELGGGKESPCAGIAHLI